MERRVVEFVEYFLGHSCNFIDVNQYVNTRRNYEAYTSLFQLKEDVIDYVKSNLNQKGLPSIEGYIGECSAKYLWIDIDVEGDIQLATKYMLDICDKLESKFSISYKSLTVFFSGNKGYHIGIPTKCFGADEVSSDILPATFKLMVKIITDNFAGIDYKIYEPTRLFRCPLSKHPKSGLYKISVSIPLIIEHGYNAMLDYAERCQRHCDYSLQIHYSEALEKIFKDCLTQSIHSVDILADEDGFSKSLSVSENRSIFRIPNKNKGESRNDIIYKMCYRLMCQPGLKVSEISDIMKFVYGAVNDYYEKQGVHRYSEMEFNVSLNSAYQRTRLRVVKDVKAKSFHFLAKFMYEKIKNSVYAKTIVPEFTEDLNGGWMLGNSYALIGKGGTMKSYYMQEEMIVSAMEEKKDSLIANLEMSDTTLYDRVWKSIFYKSMSEMIESGELNDSNILEMQDRVHSILGNHLHIFSGVDIKSQDLTSIIKSKEDEIKRKISLVGIDSVGGMENQATEALTALIVSKGLKETAKDTNTAILTINHANSSCPKDFRDAADFVRGGQKFVDNCDCYISFSSVVDLEKSVIDGEKKDIIWAKGIKYLRFVNKRGTGNTINKIIKFLDSGRIQVSDDSPASYDVDVSSGTWYK